MGEFTALHEASHAAVVAALGWPLGAISAQPGEHAQGTCLYSAPLPSGELPDALLPFALWPENWRAWATGTALVAAAGDLGVQMFAMRTGHVGDDAVTVAGGELAGRAAQDEPSEEERAAVAATVNNPDELSDTEHLLSLAWLVHGGDSPAAVAWLGYIGEEARRVLAGRGTAARRLAELARTRPVVSAQAVAACLERSSR